MNSLKISNLCFSYGNETDSPVFKNCNLLVEDSRIIGLVGINGNGKSTLLKLIKGDLSAQEGNISICEQPVTELPNVSFITQQAIDNIFPKLTVFENFILFHNRNKSSFILFDNKDNRQLCKEAIKAAGMGLENRLDEQVRFLSGGQQQALGIMLACDVTSPILLMDEPTASLDFFVAEKVFKIAIDEIRKKEGLLIFTSHNLNDIIRYTEHIIVIQNGGNMLKFANKNLDINELRKLMLN